MAALRQGKKTMRVTKFHAGNDRPCFGGSRKRLLSAELE